MVDPQARPVSILLETLPYQRLGAQNHLPAPFPGQGAQPRKRRRVVAHLQHGALVTLVHQLLGHLSGHELLARLGVAVGHAGDDGARSVDGTRLVDARDVPQAVAVSARGAVCHHGVHLALVPVDEVDVRHVHPLAERVDGTPGCAATANDEGRAAVERARRVGDVVVERVSDADDVGVCAAEDAVSVALLEEERVAGADVSALVCHFIQVRQDGDFVGHGDGGPCDSC